MSWMTTMLIGVELGRSAAVKLPGAAGIHRTPASSGVSLPVYPTGAGRGARTDRAAGRETEGAGATAGVGIGAGVGAGGGVGVCARTDATAPPDTASSAAPKETGR